MLSYDLDAREFAIPVSRRGVPHDLSDLLPSTRWRA
jgi:hypothetical protein